MIFERILPGFTPRIPDFMRWDVCGCFQKIRGKPPKWMVKIMENPMNKWMIWGFSHYFWISTHIHPYQGIAAFYERPTFEQVVKLTLRISGWAPSACARAAVENGSVAWDKTCRHSQSIVGRCCCKTEDGWWCNKPPRLFLRHLLHCCLVFLLTTCWKCNWLSMFLKKLCESTVVAASKSNIWVAIVRICRSFFPIFSLILYTQS